MAEMYYAAVAEKDERNSLFRMLKRVQRLPKAAFAKPPIRRSSFPFGTVAYFSYVPPGLSVVVSKKTARRAVDRNRIKRRVYSAAEGALEGRDLPHSTVFYPTKDVLTADFSQLRDSLQSVLRAR